MKIGIIGGGVAGLTAGYRLLQSGNEVHVYEAAPGWGGLVRTFEIGGTPLECFYHHIFNTDKLVVKMIEEMGQAEHMTWRESQVGIFSGGRVYNFVTPLDLLRFKPVGLADRVRLGLMGLYLRRRKDGRARYESVTAKDWIIKFAGKRNWDVVWEPLFRGKFGDMADKIVMTWLWNKIYLRFSSRQSGLMQKEVLGYAQGSFGGWIQELARRIRQLGGHLHAGAPVERILTSGDRATGLALASGESVALDAVIATVANKTFLRIAPDLPEDYLALCRGVPYQDALCMVLTLKRPLSHVYWLNINDNSIPFLALIEHTNLIEKEQYGGQHVLYISNYLDKESPLLQMPEEELWRLYAPHLKKINPGFEESWVTQRWLFKAPDAQPVFTLANAGRIPPHRTPAQGLYLANMSQIYPEDRGQNYSIRLGEDIARLVIADRQPAPAHTG